MSIAILCPTRGRSEQFKRMCESVERTATTPVQIISGSNGNDAYAQYKFPIDCPTGYMWNALALSNNNPHNLFMLGADDIVFSTPGWSSALEDAYAKLDNKIVVFALQDSRDHEGTPHIICSREYIEAMGYFIPPIFLHWFVDTWTVEIAKANNCFMHLNDYELIHDKPSDKGQADETHNRIRRMGWRERDRYVNDTCQYFLEFEKKRLGEKIKRELLRSWCSFCGKNKNEVEKITRGPTVQICSECVDYIKSGEQ